MKSMKKLVSLFCAALLCAAVCAPLSLTAANYTPISGGKTTFTKYLVMDKNANVPNVTFQFEIKAGDAVAETASTAAVYAGTGTPTIEDAVFTAGDLSGKSPVPATTTPGTPANPTDGEHKYAEQTVTIDLTSVFFYEPGVYRYIVTENAVNNGDLGIANDEKTQRTLDVYVTDEDGELKVSAYVLHTGTDAPGLQDVANTGEKLSTKSDGFTNTYTTHDLTFGKEVTGNQGSKDKYFAFTVELSGAVPGTVYTVDLSFADADISENPNSATTCISDAVTQPSTLKANDEGNVSQVFYLHDDQYVTIRGLAPGTRYSVTENKEQYTSDEGISSENGKNSENYTDSVSGTIKDADIMTGYTNSRQGTIPTGVMLSMLPGLLIVVLALAGIFLIHRRKQDEA